MKQLFLFMLILTLICCTVANAQTGIGTITPNPTAELEVYSTTRGFLLPRMNSNQRMAISNPATALIVYDLDSACLMISDGYGGWERVSDGKNWSLYGNAGTSEVYQLGTLHQELRFISQGKASGIIDSNMANVGLGTNALSSNATGYVNTALGTNALSANATGNYNTSIGSSSLKANINGNDNTAIGAGSLLKNTAGSSNTAIGSFTMTSNTTGSSNTALGVHALDSNTTGWNNVAVGATALLSNTTGQGNTATGPGSLALNTSGNLNSAFGVMALDSNTTGNFNTSNGAGSLYANSIGNDNTAVGFFSLSGNSTGNYNVAIGDSTLIYNTTGSYNTAIGSKADIGFGNLTNATAIGANTIVSQSNSLVLGNNANVGIGTSSPAAKLDVVGTVKIDDGTQGSGKVLTSDASGNASWQTPSASSSGNQWTTSFNGTNVYQTTIYGGTVGIGTNNPSPDTKLSVYADSKPNALYLNASSNNDYALITTFGKIGLGVSAPTEKLEVNGAVKIGNSTASPADGTMRYTAANGFQGMHSGSWQGLGGASGGGSLTLPYTGVGNTAGPAFTLVNSGNGHSMSISNTGTGAAAILSSTNGYGLLVDQGNSGFGIQTPQAKVHVVSTSTIATPNVLIDQIGTDYARLMFKNFPSSAGSWTIAAVSTGNLANDRMNFYNSTTGDVLQITGDGKTIINGPLAPAGNSGTTGKVLQSNGSSTAPGWASATNRTYNSFFAKTGTFNYIYNAGPPVSGNYGIDELLPFTSHTFTVSGNIKIIINASFDINSNFTVLNTETPGDIRLFVDGSFSGKMINYAANNNEKTFSKTFVVQLAPGNHTVDFRFNGNGGNGYLGADITGFIIEE